MGSEGKILESEEIPAWGLMKSTKAEGFIVIGSKNATSVSTCCNTQNKRGKATNISSSPEGNASTRQFIWDYRGIARVIIFDECMEDPHIQPIRFVDVVPIPSQRTCGRGLAGESEVRSGTCTFVLLCWADGRAMRKYLNKPTELMVKPIR